MGTAARPAHAERAFFLGIAAALLATVFVGFAPSFFLRPWFLPEVAADRRGFIGIDVPGKAFLAIPLVDMALFALFVGLAIARRTDPLRRLAGGVAPQAV